MALISVDSSTTYIEVLWQESIAKAVIRIGNGAVHLTADEAETVVAGLQAALAESKSEAAK